MDSGKIKKKNKQAQKEANMKRTQFKNFLITQIYVCRPKATVDVKSIQKEIDQFFVPILNRLYKKIIQRLFDGFRRKFVRYKMSKTFQINRMQFYVVMTGARYPKGFNRFRATFIDRQSVTKINHFVFRSVYDQSWRNDFLYLVDAETEKKLENRV